MCVPATPTVLRTVPSLWTAIAGVRLHDVPLTIGSESVPESISQKDLVSMLKRQKRPITMVLQRKVKGQEDDLADCTSDFPCACS